MPWTDTSLTAGNSACKWRATVGLPILIGLREAEADMADLRGDRAQDRGVAAGVVRGGAALGPARAQGADQGAEVDLRTSVTDRNLGPGHAVVVTAEVAPRAGAGATKGAVADPTGSVKARAVRRAGPGATTRARAARAVARRADLEAAARRAVHRVEKGRAAVVAGATRVRAGRRADPTGKPSGASLTAGPDRTALSRKRMKRRGLGAL